MQFITFFFHTLFYNYKNLNNVASNLLKKNNIIARCSGREEWGARSLGNRSILADPRNPRMKELLNLKIKKRENFRPFAPSIIYEHMDNWFETKRPVPYMTEVYKIKENKKSLIPAVTHTDGTGRLQTVTKANGRFYSLLSAFYKIKRFLSKSSYLNLITSYYEQKFILKRFISPGCK